MITGAKLTYEGIRLKHSEADPHNKHPILTTRRALIISCISGRTWTKYDVLVERAQDVLQIVDRTSVHEVLIPTLRYFQSLEYVTLADKEIDLSDEVAKLVGRSHGGLKLHELIRALTSQPNIMLPDNVEYAVLDAINKHPLLDILTYANDKMFVYIK